MKKIFAELFEQFVKSNKREPKGLELVKMKLKAGNLEREAKKIIEFPRDKIQPLADGGQAKPEDVSLSDFLKVQGSGNISGKNQRQGEPEGITSNKSFINLIANLDIPISEKISLLGDVQYNKFRDKIEKGDEELFLEDPASSIDRKIGIGVDSGTGITGSAKYGIDDKGFMLKIAKSFSEGGSTSTGLNYLVGEDDTNSRVPYAAGGRRGFLKLLAGLGAAGAAFKTGLMTLKGGAKPIAKEIVKEAATGQPPVYFLNLVSKIKNLGDDTLATQDKAIAKKYKDYTMEEDFAGNIEIIKKGDNVSEDVFMSLKVDDVPLKGKNKSTKVQEYEEYTARPDQDGKMKDIEQGVPDEVVQEGSMFEDNLSDFGKADGGRIGYGKGDIVTKGIPALIKKIKNKFGDDAITTADKIKTPQKTLDRDMFKAADNRLNDKKMMNADELEDFEMEIGDNIEAYDFDGTIGDAKRILQEEADYAAEMFAEYKSIGGSKRLGGPKDPMADAIDNASPGYTGDLKYDAQLVADDLAEKMYGVEYGDLTQAQQMDLYDKAYTALSKNQQGFKEMQNLSKPEKTLEGIKKTGVVDISDPDIADEFSRFMKESDPKGYKDMEQKIQLESFNPKKTKGNAEGGRIGLFLGGGLKTGKGLAREMLKFMSKGSVNAKSPKELLQLYNPKQFNKLLNNPANTGKISPATGETADEMILDMMSRTKKDRSDMVGDLIESARKIKKVDDDIKKYKQTIIKQMLDGGIDEKTARSFADKMAKEMKENAAPQLTSSPPKITEQGLLELENIQKNLLTKDRQLQASGGLATMLGE
jgi:hypothetical protein